MFYRSLALVSVLLQAALSLNYDAIVNEGMNLAELCEQCDTSTGSGYSYHPRYCHLFVHCTLGGEGRLDGQVKECTRGLLWSQKVKQCVWPSESDCPNNPCLNRQLTFRDVRNCNGYFSCPAGDRLQYNCCPSGERYSDAQGTCIKDVDCGDACLPGSANVTAKPPDCNRYPVTGDLRKYLWAVDGKNVTMTCASGTAYSDDFCSCTGTSEQEQHHFCEPYFYFPFNVNIKDVVGKTAAGGSADIRRSEAKAVGGGAAYFRGNQQVVAWAMNNMELRSNFTLYFRFKALLPDQQGRQDERYALVDNSDCDKEATFGVALLRTTHRRGTVHGGFRLKNGMAFTASSGELLLGEWHEVVLLKDGPRAELRVDGKVHPIEGQGQLWRT
ncbi:hypothetical protein V1264_013762 [Littorina saxatilis]|uniref:Chitin-binding type-2 domain-containing protein n=1 Tax=Littorina saxatilis TaxID=31220 RepID=A0AAN9BQB7_9CAEN